MPDTNRLSCHHVLAVNRHVPMAVMHAHKPIAGVWPCIVGAVGHLGLSLTASTSAQLLSGSVCILRVMHDVQATALVSSELVQGVGLPHKCAPMYMCTAE